MNRPNAYLCDTCGHRMNECRSCGHHELDHRKFRIGKADEYRLHIGSCKAMMPAVRFSPGPTPCGCGEFKT